MILSFQFLTLIIYLSINIIILNNYVLNKKITIYNIHYIIYSIIINNY